MTKHIEEARKPEPGLPSSYLRGNECQYSKDNNIPEHRCAVRCVYEEKGFTAGIEQAARVAERYDETDTLTAPKAIAADIRALSTLAATTEAYCSEGAEDDTLKECFLHHVRTTIGFLAFGTRTGPEMTMYEEGFKAGYRRCKADHELECGEADDIASALAAAEERGRIEERERCAAKEEAFDKIVAARRKHVEAVNAYNARRELAIAERMRGSWAIKLDEEYRAMHDAQSDLFATMQAVCDDAITMEPTP